MLDRHHRVCMVRVPGAEFSRFPDVGAADDESHSPRTRSTRLSRSAGNEFRRCSEAGLWSAGRRAAAWCVRARTRRAFASHSASSVAEALSALSARRAWSASRMGISSSVVVRRAFFAIPPATTRPSRRPASLDEALLDVTRANPAALRRPRSRADQSPGERQLERLASVVARADQARGADRRGHRTIPTGFAWAGDAACLASFIFFAVTSIVGASRYRLAGARRWCGPTNRRLSRALTPRRRWSPGSASWTGTTALAWAPPPAARG